MIRVANRESRTLREAYRRYWLRAYGKPDRIISDQERGILRDIFADRASAEGTELDPVGAESEYQNGKPRGPDRS